MRHVGENIKRIRKAKKMTISELAGEQISRGMISLIENGKTQPSIERLQYLARKLNVPVSDLLGSYTKSELQQIIEDGQQLINAGKNMDAAELLSPLLDELNDSPESAVLYEQYAAATGYENERVLGKAIELYEKNGMSNQTNSLQLSIATHQLKMGFITEAWTSLESTTDAIDNRLAIRCLKLKAIVKEALGDVANALVFVEEAIRIAQLTMELGEYYSLLKLKALLHYEVGDHESARSIVNTANTFIQTVQNEGLLAEHGIFFIHLEEFYENNEEIALELADEYIKYMLLESTLSPDEKKSYIERAYDMKARALVKMEEYGEALELFRQIPEDEEGKYYPIEMAMKRISSSYLATCLERSGKHEEAIDLAKRTMDKLSERSHSTYFRYAKEVAEKFRVPNR